MHLKFHVQTSGESLTAQQPDNNIVRVAIQSMAAVLGGAQSLHTNSKDEALALPTEAAVKIALRTQQIVAHESGITKTVDPLAGSYYVESLTDKIEDEVNKYLKKIDRMGGSLAGIERGFFQSEIRQNAYRLKQEIDKGERIIVGVNKFADTVEAKQDLLRIDNSIEVKQAKNLKELRSTRDNNKVENLLSKMKSASESEENLMPHIINAVKSYATLGEISNTFREVFGIYQPKETF
jgi:methylmalonyl-CoA mutase N-terminal domain/subunit